MVTFKGEFTPREHALLLSAVEDAIEMFSRIDDQRVEEVARARAGGIVREYKALRERLNQY